ncbi:IS30 family transposase [Lactovum miscens]|uniref:IS30 family transposase n=1 Tax=Lactovum miscens TaxID=190387 RepID=UPI0039C9EEF0
MLKKLPSQAFKSLICDNGKEFSDHKAIESLFDCPLYFAKPYISWQCGTNENSNGLLCRFFPKGSCSSNVSYEAIQHGTQRINVRPRKALDFKSNDDKFEECLLHLI